MSELTGDPVWELDDEGDFVAEFHGYSLVVSPDSDTECSAVIYYGKDYWSDDVHEYMVGSFRHPADAMRAAINAVLEWKREKLAVEAAQDSESWGEQAADVDG